MIKADLVEAFSTIKASNRLTYKDLEKITGLSQSQISNILKHGGGLVSSDKIEQAINALGFYVEPLEFVFIGEDDED
jgi:transcriptional regulator with XRE-family HTH domain